MPDELRPDIPAGAVFETDVPARLDRLPWARFHWLVIVALGIAWVLDGLEVTIVGSLSGALTESPVLRLTEQQVGLAASAYLIGAVTGALFFGWLTDRLGRKKLFTVTVLIYLLATIASGCAWNFWSFVIFRAITGAGIGGEYAAVNATIQELIPARRRGFTDLCINGSFWVGAAIGAAGALVVLDPNVMNPGIRLAGRLRDRGRDRLCRAAAAPLHSGKSALADDARTARARPSGSSPKSSGGSRRRPARNFRRLRIKCCHCVATFMSGSARASRAHCFISISAAPFSAPCSWRPRRSATMRCFFTYALILTRFYNIRFRQGRLVHAAVRRAISAGRCRLAGCSTRSAGRS